MTLSQRLRGTAVIRHVRLHSDYLIQDYVDLLRRDNATLREELDGVRRVGFSASGRYVFGRVVAYALLAAALLGGAVWWSQSGHAAAFMTGFQEGREASRSG